MRTKLPNRNVGIELLRTFVAVADLRSFTRAAESLHLSQPTVSGHIRRLQEQLDVDLFDRSAPGVRLTAEGELVAARARQILALHDNLVEQATAVAATKQSVIRIGVTRELPCSLLVPALVAFRRKYPDFVFALHPGASPNLIELLDAGGIDLCVAVTPQEPHRHAVRIWEENLSWIGCHPPSGPLAEPIELVGQPESTVGRSIMLSALEKAGLKHIIVFSAAQIEGALAAVRAGLGVTALLDSNRPNDLSVLGRESGLPALPRVFWGIYLGLTMRTAVGQELASTLAQLLAHS